MSVRQNISAYCEENREQFRLESQLFSEYSAWANINTGSTSKYWKMISPYLS